jgi:hypothetical protein
MDRLYKQLENRLKKVKDKTKLGEWRKRLDELKKKIKEAKPKAKPNKSGDGSANGYGIDPDGPFGPQENPCERLGPMCR